MARNLATVETIETRPLESIPATFGTPQLAETSRVNAVNKSHQPSVVACD
jgi:hypothetical protein